MSIIVTKAQRRLVDAVINKLRLSLGTYSTLKYLQDKYIDIGIDEKKAPAAADKSISVYVSTLSRESSGPTRKEEYQINVAFTARKKAIPSDMRGPALLTDSFNDRIVSIQEIIEAIIIAIDGKLDIITEANTNIQDDEYGFSTIPFYLTPNTELRVQEVGIEHFYTLPSNKGQNRKADSIGAYLVEIPFYGATRFVNSMEK